MFSVWLFEHYLRQPIHQLKYKLEEDDTAVSMRLIHVVLGSLPPHVCRIRGGGDVLWDLQREQVIVFKRGAHSSQPLHYQLTITMHVQSASERAC